MKLARVTISSTYGGLLPARMARLNPRVVDSFYAIIKGVKAAGGRLVLSDMFRPRSVQVELRRRKPRLAAKPGTSYHEAALAFDFDMSKLGIPMADFHRIALRHGWTPIRKEGWHIQHPLATLGYESIGAAIKAVGNG